MCIVWSKHIDEKFLFSGRKTTFKKKLAGFYAGSGSLCRKFLTERPFDRNPIWLYTVWTNAIWLIVHLTESPFNRTPFDRKLILPTDFFFQKIVIWPNLLSIKKCRLTENSFDWKFIWPKAFFENDHLTERSFDRKLFLKNGHLTERPFDRKSFDRMFFFWKNCRFRKIVIWPTVHIPLE
jgi:hypothetical protein